MRIELKNYKRQAIANFSSSPLCNFDEWTSFMSTNAIHILGQNEKVSSSVAENPIIIEVYSMYIFL